MELLRKILSCAVAMTLTAISGEINAQNMRSYTNRSILSSGRTVKIRVQEEGIYSFTYEELRKMGFSNPKNVHLRGYGGELLDEDFKESNQYVDDLADQPIVDLGDRIVFYLRGVVGLAKINESSTNNIGITENYTSDHSYYFLHEENTEAPKIKYADKLTEGVVKESTYTAIKWQKFDDINIAKTGRNWYGSKFNDGDSKKFTFQFDNIIAGATGYIYSNIMTSSTSISEFSILTNTTNKSEDFDKRKIKAENEDEYILGFEKTIVVDVTQSEDNTISATYKYSTESITGAGYIDYIIAAANCNLRSNVDYQMIPIGPSSKKTNITYAALNSNSTIQVWDVSEIGDVRRVPTRLSKDSLIFTVQTRPTVGRYIMFNPNGGFPTPEVVGNVDNQNIHALKDIEYVVVTNPEFIDQAKEIADFHQKEDGMSTVVVTADQVFNEFSSGTPDPTAIRAFMKMLWDKASVSDYGIFPQYLLLIGDGTFDNRRKIKTNENNKMLTYQSVKSLSESTSYTSDDYFGYVEDNTSGYDYIHMNKRLNIGVGRFPVTTAKQAEALVDKVKQYYASEPGNWRTKIVALGDDNEKTETTSSSYHAFLYQQEEAISTIESAEPRMNVSRIYWDKYTCDVSGGSNRYPEVTAEITKKFSEGTLIFNYLGHSSYNAISAEHAYSITQAKSIYNKIYPLWFAGSCNLSQFDDLRPSFGEEIILNSHGGAIASIGAVRTAYITANLSIDKAFLRQTFNSDNDYRLGKIYREAKTQLGSYSDKSYYVLLGDPGIRLKIPELNLVVDSIVTLNRDGSVVKADTLKALSKVKVYCHVEDETGNVLSQYNGVARATLKDKKTKIATKANKVFTREVDNKKVFERADPFNYYEYTNTLYSGSSVISNGKFDFQMIIPKDINYKVDYGRLSMYAYDEENGWDAMGANEDILIGGSASDIEPDDVGPYINVTTNGGNYKDGYKVNPNPMIYVDLADASGINVTGSSIGHNITLTIDENTKNVINLNSYFSYNTSSCTEGRVEYHTEKALSEGWHTIKVKAWDLQNNSSESTIKIYVCENIAPDIETLTVYPNPVKDKFTAYIKTNRPDEVQTMECTLLDLSGRQISRKDLKDKTTDGTWKIEWNLNDSGRISNGLYLLYVRIATEKSDFAEKTEKIIVVDQ
ncbi:MAG: type IX secretion system sortase PorU [Paludibacteraceae bacterium]|nr:type IX secretion system sortase PorU [Paludibacteraceae bacterium]